MPGLTFLPSKELDLLNWSTNFDTRLTATPVALGMTSGQATTYHTAHLAFAAALTAATEPSTRTKGTIQAKKTAMYNLKVLARSYGKMIDANVIVTNQQRADLGLTVRNPPSPIPVPSTMPGLEIRSVTGWTVKIKLNDTASSAKRGKPPGVSGAAIFSHVGETIPSDLSAWKFEGNTGRTTVDVVFAGTVAAGSKVYLTAFWFNGRKQSGPACNPVAAYIQYGALSQAA